MSTLADELLQDFEDDALEDDIPEDDGISEDADAANENEAASSDGTGDEKMTDAAAVETEAAAVASMDDADEAKARAEKMQLGMVKDVRSVANLMQTLEPVIEKIEMFKSQPQTTVLGNVEDHPEYRLLTQSNSLSTHIDSEIVVVHKFIRDHYSVRFPELERLIGNPLGYAKVVAILGNGPLDATSLKRLQDSTDNPIGVSLRSVIDGPTLMVVALEATTTKGREMHPDEITRVVRACKTVVSLDKAKTTLTDYVQSRMNIFAPNLTALIGSLTAAQLLNTAGGLVRLASTPSCNLAAWGSKKQAAPGLATNVGIRQQGFIYHSPLIKGIPNDLKRQAMRIVSAKLVLAARGDLNHSNPDGALGEELKAACLGRLDKLTEPPPIKGKRALPVPDDKPSRKRGGRRARKAKEATAMTEMRKAQNRMAFGKEEKEVGYGTGDGTVGLGMIGHANDGRIRGIQIDQRTRAKLSQKHKGWGDVSSLNGGMASSLKGFGQAGSNISLAAKGLRSTGVGSTLGTQSSLAFAPNQSLELVVPKVREGLDRKRKAEEERWFKGGTFTQIGSSSGPPTKKLDTGAGKMAPPPIPPKKPTINL